MVKNDHNAGYAFTEKSFLPPGTRPGPAGGVPPGKVSFVLDVEKVAGIRDLRIGDHVNLLGSQVVDDDKMLEKIRDHRENQGMYGAQAAGLGLTRHAGVTPLVQDGVVVLPVTSRQVPVPGSIIGHDGKPKTRVIEEVMIAIDPREVAPLTEALAVHAGVCCVAHSGYPNDRPAPTPGYTPPPRVKTVETIRGNKREVLVFPGAGGGPILFESQPAPKMAPSTAPPAEEPGDASALPKTGNAPG